MPETLRERDVSPAVRRRYIRRIKQAQRAIGRLERSAVASAVRDLEQARRNIMASLLDATPFGQWHLPQVRRVVEEALEEFRDKATRTHSAMIERAWDLGDSRVSSLARSAGIDVTEPAWKFGIPRDQLEFAQGFGADLVQAESDDVLKMISKELRLASAGGATREQLIQRIQKKITKPLRFGTMRKRAETIARTEVNRVHNAAGQARREQLEASNVKVQKKWLSAQDSRTRTEHRQLHGKTVDADKPFPYPNLPRSMWPMYPLDPVLPAEHSINCRCAVIEVFVTIDEEGVETEVTA
jgi:SPP1 gp7 family putative phage head morphogenesis protein